MPRGYSWKNSTRTRSYNSWISMRNRCLSSNNKDYHSYGGRGISICDRWINDYDAFVEDMGEPEKGYSLDRIDSNGNYEPNNCRWATMKEQQNNRRNNIYLELNGQRKTISQWSESNGIHPVTLYP